MIPPTSVSIVWVSHTYNEGYKFLHIMNWVYANMSSYPGVYVDSTDVVPFWSLIIFFQKTSSFPKESPYWHTFFCIFSSIQCGKQLWSNFCNKGARKTNFGDDPTSWFTTSRPWQFVDCLTCKYIYILTLYCGLKSEKSSNSKQLHHLFKKGLKLKLFEIFIFTQR